MCSIVMMYVNVLDNCRVFKYITQQKKVWVLGMAWVLKIILVIDFPTNFFRTNLALKTRNTSNEKKKLFSTSTNLFQVEYLPNTNINSFENRPNSIIQLTVFQTNKTSCIIPRTRSLLQSVSYRYHNIDYKSGVFAKLIISYISYG